MISKINWEEMINPAQVSSLLHISVLQVDRLCRQGYLRPGAGVAFRNGPMLLFRRSEVENLRAGMAQIRRRWQSEQSQRLGGRAAAEAREREHRGVQRIKQQKQAFLEACTMLPEPVGRLLRASFFLFHLNHYAKSGERYLYDLKEVVLRSLAEQAGRWQEENMIRIFILPGSERVKLCSRCREKARKMGLNYSEFVRLIGGCRQCPRSAEYYSLYEFLIEYDRYRFCFHIPAELAHNWAGNSSLTMRETPAEREGFMLFGRPAFQAETRAVELTEVIAELRSFLCWLNVLLPRELESLSAVQMDTVFIDLSTFPNCQSRI